MSRLLPVKLLPVPWINNIKRLFFVIVTFFKISKYALNIQMEQKQKTIGWTWMRRTGTPLIELVIMNIYGINASFSNNNNNNSVFLYKFFYI